VRTNSHIESPEEYFRFNFGCDVVKDSEKIMKEADPEWKLPEVFVSKKATEPGVKKPEARVSVRSIVAGIESINVKILDVLTCICA
jgi:hypothetical protein